LYKVLTLNEKNIWSEYLNKLPISHQDIYYTPQYYQVYEKNGYGKANCFVFKKNDDIAIYPFLINCINDLGYDLNDKYFDIQGAYGYNGVITSNTSKAFKSIFQEEFNNYCFKNNIVAEFTRFNPVIKNQNFSDNLSIVKENKDIIVDLNFSEDYMLKNIYDRSVRKNINKAIRNDLTIKHFSGDKINNDWINKFKEIYNSTLQRRSADKYYYFSDNYFTSLNKKMGTNISYFFTQIKNKTISCELVTYKNHNAYSFLGGTLSEYFSYRPNDILKHQIINHLRKEGCKYFCLGGGVSEGDGIYKYKKSFSKNGINDFFIGKKIYLNDIYNKICGEWLDKSPEKKDLFSNYLLKYRY